MIKMNDLGYTRQSSIIYCQKVPIIDIISSFDSQPKTQYVLNIVACIPWIIKCSNPVDY